MQAAPAEQRTAWTDRLVVIAPWAVLAYLAAFAWRFADERLFADSGYYLARVVNDGGFRIEHGRWVLAIAQALPLIGVKLGLPMKALIMLHSLSNVIWMGACIVIAQRVLRDRYAALAIAALHLVGLTHGLLCPVFELYYGADLLVLFIAVHRSTSVGGRWRLPLLVLLGALVASCHAIGFLLLAGMLVLLRAWEQRREAVILAFVIGLVLLARVLTVSAYEKDSAAFVLQARDPQAMAAVLSLRSLTGMFHYAVRHYPDLLALSAIAFTGLLIQRRRMDAVLFIGFIAMMHVLISLKLPGWYHDRYREQVNFGIAAWVVLVLVLRCGRIIQAPALIPLAIALALFFRMAQAERMAPYYTDRTAHIESQIDQARELGLSKGIISAAADFAPEHHGLPLFWSVPVESLLLSAKHGPSG
ncbi:MAG: hypothetical protein WAT74_02270, partial [Flavobacteriales bacterium]